jgi:hypothetical protein
MQERGDSDSSSSSSAFMAKVRARSVKEGNSGLGRHEGMVLYKELMFIPLLARVMAC